MECVKCGSVRHLLVERLLFLALLVRVAASEAVAVVDLVAVVVLAVQGLAIRVSVVSPGLAGLACCLPGLEPAYSEAQVLVVDVHVLVKTCRVIRQPAWA